MRPTSTDFAPEHMRSRIGNLVLGAQDPDPITEAHLHLAEAKRLASLEGKLPSGVIHSNRILHQNRAAEVRRNAGS